MRALNCGRARFPVSRRVRNTAKYRRPLSCRLSCLIKRPGRSSRGTRTGECTLHPLIIPFSTMLSCLSSFFLFSFPHARRAFGPDHLNLFSSYSSFHKHITDKTPDLATVNRYHHVGHSVSGYSTNASIASLLQARTLQIHHVPACRLSRTQGRHRPRWRDGYALHVQACQGYCP